MKDDIRPPRWIESVLKQFADEETLEEVEGDLLEFYPKWMADKGRVLANWKYFFTVVTLLRPFRKNRKRLFNSTMLVMIKSYFIMSWRSMLRNKVSSFINICGLTLGLTTSLLVLLVVLREFEYDDHHVKKDVLFVMMKNQKTNDGVSTGRSVPGPLAETLKSDYPQVVHASRIAHFHNHNIPLIVNNQKSFESGVFVDPDMFRMMTYPAIKGDPVKALENNSIVISQSMATKLFGDREALGQLVVLDGSTLSVGSIIADLPSASSLWFEVAAPFKVFEKKNEWLSKWDDNRIQTWVELTSRDALEEFNHEISPLMFQKTHEGNDTAFAYPLDRIHLYGGFSNGQPSGGKITIIWVLCGFGLFMLLIACVNFMNITTAQATRRAKEVGVRKTLGAARSSIVFQFLNESLVITFLSLIAAIGLCVLLIPSFNTMLHAQISFDFGKAIVWILCFSVALLTALVAGSYPAFILSRFSPSRVLKGIVEHARGVTLRRILVTFQFVISSAVLIGTVILYEQFDHVKKRPIGYEQENLINVSLDSVATAKFDAVKNEVSKIAGVKSVTGMGGNILYSGGAITGMDWPGKKPGEDLAVTVAHASYDWSETMGIQIVAGRDFDDRFKSDENGILINQSAVDKMGLLNPVGSIVGGHPVIGVFRNFVYNNPSGVISPMMIFLTKDIHKLYIRIDNNNSWTETIAAIEKSVKQASPDLAFDFRFTSDEYQSNFEEVSNAGLMVSIFGGITIFISCLGLFGLSGFVAERRSKEMSIRKVFGADSMRVLLSLSSDILKPVVVALLIVIPVSVWIAGMLLEEFVYHVSLQWWMFAQAAFAIVAVATAVSLYHTWRTAGENPSVRLKSE
jgi:putative ABC transport system permease protein